MTDPTGAALAFARENQARFLEELKAFVRIPSISTDPTAKPDMQRAAEWAAGKLTGLGAKNVQIKPTGGHPVVYGEMQDAGPGKPTILVYGHYDVQPVEPLELWNTPPFEPELRGENLFGRGASDMKGQIIVALAAIEAVLKNGGLPANIKFLLEGEEEIGSPNLEKFIQANKELLRSDFALNPDAGMIGAGKPTITYGLRGMTYMEIRLSGPDHDLHSGLYGGTVHNPAQVLCELIAGMHDEKGHITLPGFYDKVRELSRDERAELARLPVDEKFYLDQTGVPELYGEAGFTPLERVGARPTLEVNGILSGFTGEGQKTVLPMKSMAKISCRLVPDQDPKEVFQQMRQYLEQKTPPSVRWELILHSTGSPSITSRDLPAVKAMHQAMLETWGVQPLYRREGGSIPVTAQMCDYLGIESVLTGFGLPDDNLHAPNEKVHLPTFYRGIETLVRFFLNLEKS